MPLLTADQIAARVRALGQQITQDYAGRRLVLVSVLKGSFVFTADLARARRRCLVAGVRPDRILLDPGLGFGKTAEQNFELLARLPELVPEGTPVVVGASRKAFLGSLSGRPPADRLPESLAACAVAERGSIGLR